MILRQSTSQIERFGPFLDSTDFITEETALTIAQADMQLSKDGGAFAQKSAAGNATHDTDGWYSTTLSTTDTDTVGELLLQVNVTGSIPVWVRWYVVEEAVYDSMYAASSAGPLQSTVAGRTLDVTATGASGVDWGNVENPGTTVDLSATDIQLVDTATTVTDGATAAALATVQADTDDIQTRLPAALVAGRMSSDAVAISGSTAAADSVEANIGNLDALVSGANTVTPLAAATDQAEHDATQGAITALNDLSAAQVNAEVDTALTDIHLDHLLAVDYDPASQPGVATALLNELIESDAGVSRYTANALEQAPTGGSAPTVAQIADGVWDEPRAGHSTASTYGENTGDAAMRGTDGANTVTPLAAATDQAEHDATQADIAALNDLSAAQVNAEVDTALTDIGLDHMVSAAVAGVDITDDSIIAQLASSAATADWDTFDNTTDSLQAIADSGGGGPTAAQIADAVWDEDIVAAHGTADTAGETVSQLTKRAVTFSAEVVDGSVLGQMADDGTAVFDRTTDSLQAIADSGGGAPTAGQIADAVWDEPRAGHVTASTYGENTGDAAMRGTDGANTTVPLAAATDQAEHDATQVAVAALNDLSAAQVNAEVDTALADVHLDHLLAVDYDPASPPGVATALLNELIEDDGGVSRYTANALEQAPTGGSAPTVAQIADGVWDELRAGHTTASTYGEFTGDAAMRGTDGANTIVPLAAATDQAEHDATQVAVAAVPTAVENRQEMDSNSTQLAAIFTDTDVTIPGLIAALNDLSAAQVNAEVLDVLSVDGFAEPTGVPPATINLATKIGFIYMALRNRIDVDATDKTFYDDGGLAEWKKALSDDGTTYTEAEASTP